MKFYKISTTVCIPMIWKKSMSHDENFQGEGAKKRARSHINNISACSYKAEEKKFSMHYTFIKH